MARVVTEKEHTFDQEQASQYPWRVWSDGQQRLLEPGTDFDGPPEELEETVYQQARRRGLKARTEIDGTGLYIQFETKTVETGTKASARRGRKIDEESLEFTSTASISPHIPRFNRRNRPRNGYPWGEWADGQVHKLLKGRHYRNPTENFMVAAYTKAKTMGKKVRSKRVNNGVIIQFYDT